MRHFAHLLTTCTTLCYSGLRPHPRLAPRAAIHPAPSGETTVVEDTIDYQLVLTDAKTALDGIFEAYLDDTNDALVLEVAMVLKPQTIRNWKIFTGFACTATLFHTVFRVDYGPHDHCFSGVQKWYNDEVDTLLGIGPTAKAQQLSPETETGRTEGEQGRPPSPPANKTAR